MACRDVEKAQLVGTRRIVGRRGLDGIASVLEVNEIDALDDAPVLDVKAGNDADFQGHSQKSPISVGFFAFALVSQPSCRVCVGSDGLKLHFSTTYALSSGKLQLGSALSNRRV